MEQVDFNAPTGWSWKKFKDVCVLKRGYDLPTHARSAGDFPLYSANGVTDYIDQYKVDGPGVVTGRSGTIGKVHFVEGDYWPLNTALYVQKFNGNHPRFIKYFLENFDLTRFASGAAVPTLNRNSLSAELVCVPDSVDEQKRIVEKLDALLTRIDTAIEHLQENLATSKLLLASALFEKFHQEVNPTPIKDIFNVYNGRAYKKPELLDSGKYKVIRIQNLKGGENYYYSDLELDENKYCENGDLLFSWSGTPGTSFGAFIWNNERAIYHYHIWKMEPKVDIAPGYAYWVLKDITEEAIANARGVAGMLHITKGTMESFIVSLPSYEAQQKIAKELDELALKSEQLQAEISSKIDSLKHLKASILDSAFKGEL